MDSCDLFIHILQGCFTGNEATLACDVILKDDDITDNEQTTAEYVEILFKAKAFENVICKMFLFVRALKCKTTLLVV